MAIVFVKGQVTRDPFFKTGGKTDFAGFKLVETYVQRGETKIAGYHDIVAFDDMARRAADFREGDTLDIKGNLRYRADNRYTDDKGNNPFTAQIVLTEIREHNIGDDVGF